MAKKPVIHLLAVAGTCQRVLDALKFDSAKQFIRFVQDAVGPDYRVTGDEKLIEAPEDDYHGGRNDDARRAKDIQKCLADNEVAAAVTLRGGAWLTRVLPMIDFDVLKKRRTKIALFGFSEITTMNNIMGCYPKAFSYYDMGPGFLLGGMTGYAKRNLKKLAPDLDAESEAADAFAKGWASGQVHGRFTEFFGDVINVLEGRGSSRSIKGKLISGKLPAKSEAAFIGGNLTVMLALAASQQYRKCLDPAGKWIALEDLNENADCVDRHLALLKLAGFWEKCAGVLIGDFHDKDGDSQHAVVNFMKYHLPKNSQTPVVTTRDVGHIWPLSPLPIGRPLTILKSAGQKTPTVKIEIPWSDWAVR